MTLDFTPAADRVLAFAADWSNRTDDPALQLPEILLALLAEPECRAAVLLAERGIETAAVRERWPQLAPLDEVAAGRRRPMSPTLLSALEMAKARLSELPQPISLATEHLLLALLLADDEVSRWLAGRGLCADALHRQILALHDIEPGPLAVDFGDLPSPSDLELVPQPSVAASRHAFASRFGVVPTTAGDDRTAPSHNKVRLVDTQERTQQPTETPVLRVIDAAANRAREGLRVVEDFARFVLDDRFLTEQLKQLRHGLVEALAEFPQVELLASRETLADVGTQISTSNERHRADLDAIVAANLKRLQESLRTLEEFAKLSQPAAAGKLEQLRYTAYTLERAVLLVWHNRARLEKARLYVLVEGLDSPRAFGRLIDALIAAGVHIIQLRDKRLDDRQRLARCRQLRMQTSGTETLAIVNDRPDLATLSRADGVHLGQEELSVKEARGLLSPSALVGVSTHSIEQARQAVLDGADYIGVGPTFPSVTKQFEDFPSLELLRSVAAEITLPAFAIGGVCADNLPLVLAAGIRRIAVSSAICRAPDPGAAARQLLEMLGGG